MSKNVPSYPCPNVLVNSHFSPGGESWGESKDWLLLMEDLLKDVLELESQLGAL